MARRTRLSLIACSAAAVAVGGAVTANGARQHAAKTQINVGIDIPFHPIFNYVV